MHLIFSLLYALLVMGTILLCSPQNQGVYDAKWQEESLKMAGEICTKIKNCGEEIGAFKGLTPAEMKIADKRLTEVSCQDYHRTTNTYNLVGDDPGSIKINSRNCYTEMIQMNCRDLVKKKIFGNTFMHLHRKYPTEKVGLSIK